MVQGVGKGGKHNYDELRLDCLKYLYLNRNSPGERTFTKIKKEFKFGHAAPFNKMIYFLIGAGYVQEDLVGSTWLYSLTDKGIITLEKMKLEEE